MRLLSELGQDSRWAKAMYDDPEMADEMAASALKNAGKKWRPSNADWGLLNEQLATMIDLQQMHLRMLSSTPNRTVPPYPRPVTEFSRALELLTEQQAESELARVYDFVAEGQRRWREGHRPAPYDPGT